MATTLQCCLGYIRPHSMQVAFVDAEFLKIDRRRAGRAHLIIANDVLAHVLCAIASLPVGAGEGGAASSKSGPPWLGLLRSVFRDASVRSSFVVRSMFST